MARDVGIDDVGAVLQQVVKISNIFTGGATVTLFDFVVVYNGDKSKWRTGAEVLSTIAWLLLSIVCLAIARIACFNIHSCTYRPILITINWKLQNRKTAWSVRLIRLEARLQPNIRNTSRPVLMVFTRSGMTPPKVNRFGWNLEHSKDIVLGWPWQILGAIRAVAREPANFLSGKHRTISPTSRR